MVDSRTNFAKDISALLRDTYGSKIKVFGTEIPHSVRAKETSAEGKSIFAHDPGGKVAEGYANLTKEVLKIEKQREKVVDIPLSELHPFKNHPFKVKDDEAMMDTAESIKQYGVLVPAIVRPDPNGGYELVAGHRRHHASEIAGKDTMPVIIRNLDDDAATIIMVDSNLQREELLPSERTFAYKMKLEAMKRQAGRPSKENGSQLGNDYGGKKSSEILAEQVGQSKNQIFRYVRLTELIPELLNMVDEKKIAFNPAYDCLSSNQRNKDSSLSLWTRNRLPLLFHRHSG